MIAVAENSADEHEGRPRPRPVQLRLRFRFNRLLRPIVVRRKPYSGLSQRVAHGPSLLLDPEAFTSLPSARLTAVVIL